MDHSAAIRAELSTPATSVVFLHRAAGTAQGPRVLIDALAGLKDATGWVAWIAGGVPRPADADYLDELKARAAAPGVGDRVRFIGHRTDPHRLMAAADIMPAEHRPGTIWDRICGSAVRRPAGGDDSDRWRPRGDRCRVWRAGPAERRAGLGGSTR